MNHELFSDNFCHDLYLLLCVFKTTVLKLLPVLAIKTSDTVTSNEIDLDKVNADYSTLLKLSSDDQNRRVSLTLIYGFS